LPRPAGGALSLKCRGVLFGRSYDSWNLNIPKLYLYRKGDHLVCYVSPNQDRTFLVIFGKNHEEWHSPRALFWVLYAPICSSSAMCRFNLL
jgi:hypothetical protein